MAMCVCGVGMLMCLFVLGHLGDVVDDLRDSVAHRGGRGHKSVGNIQTRK